MKKVLFLMMVMTLGVMNQVTFANDNKNLLGTWNVEVADAPAEFVKSSMTVTEEKGKLSAKVTFQNGQMLEVSDIQFSKVTINLIVNIDGTDVRVSGKVENSKITGKVEAPDGVLQMVAVKKI